MEVNILTECQCPCFELMKLLQKTVTSLELQVQNHGQLLNDFDKIKAELLTEVKGHSSGRASTSLSTLSNPHVHQKNDDLHGSNSNLTKFGDEPVNKKSKLDSDRSDIDTLKYGTLSPASTPNLVTNYSFGLAKSSSIQFKCEPGFSGKLCADKRSSGLISAVNDHGQIQSDNDDWQSLDQPVDYSRSNANRAEEILHLEARTEPESIRRNKNTGNAEKPSGSQSNNFLVCQDCNTGFEFKEMLYLQRHYRRFHSGDQEVYPCEYCEQTFVYKERLATHVSATHEGIRYKCDTLGCNSIFTRKSDLRRHQKRKFHTECFTKIRINVQGTNAINHHV